MSSRTFGLFEELGMKKNTSTKPEDRKPGDLIEYLLSGTNVPTYYNGVQIVPKDGKKPTARDYKIAGLPAKYV